jgi:hypothetical protein
MRKKPLVLSLAALMIVGILYAFSEQKDRRDIAQNQPALDKADDSKNTLIRTYELESVEDSPHQPQVLLDNTPNSPSVESGSESASAHICSELEQSSSHLEQEYIELFDQIYGFDFTGSIDNEYANYDEAGLLVLADTGDPRAMLMLGFNYRWYARFKQFKTQVFATQTSERRAEKRTEINGDHLRSSNYWFEQAAFHGLPNALIEKRLNYYLLIRINQPDAVIGDVTKVKNFERTAKKFVYWVIPQYEKLVPREIFDDALEPVVTEHLKKLQDRWISMRKQQGKPIHIQLDYSNELESLLNDLYTCTRR